MTKLNNLVRSSVEDGAVAHSARMEPHFYYVTAIESASKRLDDSVATRARRADVDFVSRKVVADTCEVTPFVVFNKG